MSFKLDFLNKNQHMVNGGGGGGLLTATSLVGLGDGDALHGVILPTVLSVLVDQSGEAVECSLGVTSVDLDVHGACNGFVLLHNFIFPSVK